MDATRVIIILVAVLYVLFWIAVSAGIVYLFILIVKALKKYVNSKEVREEKKAVAKSLGEALKENRIHCQMTQEFVAETLGVSRQSVSKWENGSSDPRKHAATRSFCVAPATCPRCQAGCTIHRVDCCRCRTICGAQHGPEQKHHYRSRWGYRSLRRSCCGSQRPSWRQSQTGQRHLIQKQLHLT